MADLTLSAAERERLRDELERYCRDQFDLHLEQFDAEFLSILLSINWAPPSTTPALKRRSALTLRGMNGFRRRWI